ncbi:hypothetical protein BJ138DRAFT_111451 [Hygrophoropsis aurantiaca]|uniref:Uncharacterized protein n=1 Tax=Hygrophoropsis aurantiaca TaxID=72124 RepID=A0ACB8ABD0_9AGAM|nr:hypothetical protein BJ138DRAFT_111451 [Hygrophoropsis aurantiaca]
MVILGFMLMLLYTKALFGATSPTHTTGINSEPADRARQIVANDKVQPKFHFGPTKDPRWRCVESALTGIGSNPFIFLQRRPRVLMICLEELPARGGKSSFCTDFVKLQ